ncbi:MAG: PKD domain-containing protein, partial [Flavobacteriales bacterium]|nr:PKD domain-containing protein [Flavobacteriales bacterium]
MIGIEPVADCCFQLQPIYLVDCVSNNTYQWVIDGTVVSNDASYLHCFPAAGAHSICLNVYCPDGNLGISFCETVDCGGGSGCCQPSDFTYVCDGCCFTFSPLYLVDCVSFNAYFWQFGDGAVSTEENPTHCYATSGVYQVCLTATCPDGSVYTFCQWVTANCPAMCCPPSGIFANQNTDCCWEFGPEYFLTDCDPAGNQYYWQFGDGNVSYDAYPVHCYAADGIYDVCLTVICPDGQTYTLCETITTDCQPCDVALFPQVVQNGCIWTVTFVNNGTTPLNEICVIVEGGVVITADQYIQVLDFSNNCNSGWGICYQYWCCNDPNSMPVGLCVDYIVNCCCDDVPADFTWVNTSDCCTQFFGPGSEPFTGIPCISWDFGDGTTSNELNPVHCWSGPG